MGKAQKQFKDFKADNRHALTDAYIIKALIKDPLAIVVSSNSDNKNAMKTRYFEELKRHTNFFTKIKWSIQGRVQPMFVTVNNLPDLENSSIPILLDNSVQNTL